MIIENNIFNKIGFGFLIIVLSTISLKISAQEATPFFRSFLDGNLDNVEFPGPTPSGVTRTNQAILVENLGLRLTNKKTEVGAFYLSDYSMKTDEGLRIEFEYMMYGNAEITDGICMFLVVDKPQYTGNNLKFAAEGAGFGYTYSWSLTGASNTPYRKMGIKGGYLAVALDQGNFKVLRYEGNEIRSGIPYGWVGLPARRITSMKEEENNTASNITIRGAAAQQSQYVSSYFGTLQEGYWGYPVLATRHTGGSGMDTQGLRNKVGFIMNTSTGEFEQHVEPTIAQPFDIASQKTFKDSDDSAYRKAILTMEPNEVDGGFLVTVAIQHGKDKTIVIEKFTYPSTVRVLENQVYVGTNGGWPTFPNTTPGYSYTVPTPDNLVIGFASSTGKYDYTNVIKNLRITPFYGAQTEDDIIEHRRGPVTVLPLENDWGYVKEGGEISEGKENLDPNSFRFWEDEYKVCDDKFAYVDPLGKGKWSYNPATAEVVCEPRKGFTGEVSIYYDISSKLGLFSASRFRSSLAKIVVKFGENPPKP